MTHVFVICPFHPVKLNETSYIFILFNSGQKWLKLELEIWIFRAIRSKTIFQTKWTKNTDELKIYLVWFSSTVCREQFVLKFLKVFERKTFENIYAIFTSFQFKIINMSAFMDFCVVSGFVYVALIYFFFIKRELLVGETLIEIGSAVAIQTKKCDFVSFKTLCQWQIFTTVKGISKNISWI